MGNKKAALSYHIQALYSYYKKGSYAQLQDINYLLLTPITNNNNNNKDDNFLLIDGNQWAEIVRDLDTQEPTTTQMCATLRSFFAFSTMYDIWWATSQSNSNNNNNTSNNSADQQQSTTSKETPISSETANRRSKPHIIYNE